VNTLHVASGVTLQGHTAGTATLTNFDQTFSVTPEPGTYAMFAGMGVTGGLMSFRRMRRRGKKA